MADKTTEGRISEVKEHVDVLDEKGNSVDMGESPLADLFNKIEAGKSEGKTAKEVIADVQPVEKAVPADKKEEKKDDKLDFEERKSEEKKEEVQEKSEEKLSARAQLLKEFDKSSEKNEVKKPEEKAEDKDEDEIADDELQVLPNDKPKTAKRIQALLKRVEAVQQAEASTKKELQDRDAKLKELNEQLAKVKTVDPKTEEGIQKAKDELSMLRRRYDLDNDPEIKTKFDGRNESAEKSIIDTLTKFGAGDAILKIIKEEGGWTKFAESGRSYTLKAPIIKDGVEVTTVTGAEFADVIVAQLPLTARRSVDAAMVDQAQTKREKERFFQDEQGKANQFFQEREQNAKKQTDDYQNRVKDAAKTIENWEKEITTKNKWLQEQELPDNATPEQKKTIGEDNKHAQLLKGLIKQALSINKVEDSLEVVLDSVRYHQERRDKGKALDRVKTLEAELVVKQKEIDKFKRGGTTVRGGSLNGGGGAAAPGREDAKPKSLEDALDAIARGENVGGRKRDSDDE